MHTVDYIVKLNVLRPAKPKTMKSLFIRIPILLTWRGGSTPAAADQYKNHQHLISQNEMFGTKVDNSTSFKQV